MRSISNMGIIHLIDLVGHLLEQEYKSFVITATGAVLPIEIEYCFSWTTVLRAPRRFSR